MQCDDDPLSQFACDDGRNQLDEGGVAKGWDSALRQELGMGVEDSSSNGFFGREKYDGGAGGGGVDSRPVGAKGSNGGRNGKESESFHRAGDSLSSSVFIPFGDNALGKQTKQQQHHVQQNVDDQQSASLTLPFQYPDAEQSSSPPVPPHAPSPLPLPSMYASQPSPLTDAHNTGDNYPGHRSSPVTNIPNFPAYNGSASMFSDVRGSNTLPHDRGASSSFQYSVHYQSFPGFGGMGGSEVLEKTETLGVDNEAMVVGSMNNRKKQQQPPPKHLIGGNRSLLNVHNFYAHKYTKPILCDACGDLLVGLVNNGYICIECGMNIHEKCQQVLCSPRHKCSPPYKAKSSSGICDGQDVVCSMVGADCEILKSPQAQTMLRLTENKTLPDPCDEVWHKHLLRSNQKWVPDSAALACMICNCKFTIFIRRHHCRRCGACICKSCSSSRVSDKVLAMEHERIVKQQQQQHSIETMVAPDGGIGMRTDWKNVNPMEKLDDRITTVNRWDGLLSMITQYYIKNKGSSGENDTTPAALRTCTRCTRIIDKHISHELRSAGYRLQQKSKKQQHSEQSNNNLVKSGWQGQAYPPRTTQEEYLSDFAEMHQQQHEVSHVGLYSGSHGASEHHPKEPPPPPHYGGPVVTDHHLLSFHGSTTTSTASYESSHRAVL